MATNEVDPIIVLNQSSELAVRYADAVRKVQVASAALKDAQKVFDEALGELIAIGASLDDEAQKAFDDPLTAGEGSYNAEEIQKIFSKVWEDMKNPSDILDDGTS